MTYNILEYSYNRAKRLGVEIKPSTNPRKKIDVFRNEELIAQIGGVRPNGIAYLDYPTLLMKERKGEVKKYSARIRQILYKKRHEKDRHKVDTPGYFADQILW
jgi:hypothetical protein